MAFNGSGTFNRIYNWTTDAGNGINIEPSRMDGEDNSFATGLSNCITKDGQTTITANIPFNSKKITGLANGSARTDSIALGQVQDNSYGTLGTLGGSANTYTASPSPAITAYVAGMEFNFKVNATNTGASTLNISGLGAKNIKKYSAGSKVNIEAGDLQENKYNKVIFDGTDYMLLNPEIIDNLKSNNLTVNNKLNTQQNTATISSGAITYTGAYMVVDTEGSASSDDLDTINGGNDGDILIIKTANDSRSVVIKHGTGSNNINLTNAQDKTLAITRDAFVLQKVGDGYWEEITHSISADFANSSTTNGYTYLPNGLILQWGIASSVSLNSNTTVTLPTAFPSNIFNIQVTPAHNNANEDVCGGTAISTSQILITNGSGFTASLYWTVIGN